MTNGEKFKTPIERRRAYNQYFERCEKENLGIPDEFEWIDFEYKVELKNCPFCGGEAMERKSNKLYYVFCKNCSVKTVDSITLNNAIAAWNRRA